MNERVRNLLVAGVLLTGSLEACSPAATQTPNPTPERTPANTPALTATPAAPTESPIPSMTIVPTESPFVSPSPSITPEASQSPAESFSADSFLADLNAGGHALDKYKTPITVAKLDEAYSALMASPAAPTAGQFPNTYKDCKNSSLDQNTRWGQCEILTTGGALKAIAKNPQSVEAKAFGFSLASFELQKVFTTKAGISNLTQAVALFVQNY